MFVPEVSSPAKIERIRGYGADLVVGGATYAEALAASEEWVASSGALPVPAFDQIETILGAGTLGTELKQQAPAASTVLASVGGGGLLAGICAAYAGQARVIGVEPAGAPTLTRALRAGRPVDAGAGSVAVDSLAPRQVGQHTFAVIREFVRQVVLVSDEDIVRAQELLWDRLRVVAEPGGCAALAALLAGRYSPGPGRDGRGRDQRGEHDRGQLPPLTAGPLRRPVFHARCTATGRVPGGVGTRPAARHPPRRQEAAGGQGGRLWVPDRLGCGRCGRDRWLGLGAAEGDGVALPGGLALADGEGCWLGWGVGRPPGLPDWPAGPDPGSPACGSRRCPVGSWMAGAGARLPDATGRPGGPSGPRHDHRRRLAGLAGSGRQPGGRRGRADLVRAGGGPARGGRVDGVVGQPLGRGGQVPGVGHREQPAHEDGAGGRPCGPPGARPGLPAGVPLRGLGRELRPGGPGRAVRERPELRERPGLRGQLTAFGGRRQRGEHLGDRLPPGGVLARPAPARPVTARPAPSSNTSRDRSRLGRSGRLRRSCRVMLPTKRRGGGPRYTGLVRTGGRRFSRSGSARDAGFLQIRGQPP